MLRVRRAMRRKIIQKLRRIKFRSNFKIRGQIPLPFIFLSTPLLATDISAKDRRCLYFPDCAACSGSVCFANFSYFAAAVSAPAAAVLAAALGFAAWRYIAAALFARLARYPL